MSQKKKKKNSLYTFSQSGERYWVQCIIITITIITMTMIMTMIIAINNYYMSMEDSQ